MLPETGNKRVIGEFSAGSFRLILNEGPLELAWKHCSIVSDFLGNLYSAHSRNLTIDATHVSHNVSYMVNEIIENALKFRSAGDIEIVSAVEGGQFRLRVTNLVTRGAAVRFQDVLAGLEGRDPSEMLIERIEQNAADAASATSGIGLLTLMSDYGVRVGWKFAKHGEADDIVRLETHAVLPLE